MMKTEVKVKAFNTILIIVALIIEYILTLRFVFPNYFSPFTTHHSDMLDYAYDFENSYMWYAARPTGMLLTHIWGMLGNRFGIVISAVLSEVLSIILIADILKKELELEVYFSNILLYGFILFSSTTFYINYSFDIYGTYAQVIGLLAYRVLLLDWNTNIKRIIAMVLFFFGFLAKETYIVTFCFVLLARLLVCDSKKIKNGLFDLCCCMLVSGASLLYSKLFKSPFVGIDDVNSPYHVSLEPSSVLHTLWYYVQGSISYVVIILYFCIMIYLTSIKAKKKILFGICFATAGLLAYLPYSVLPNKMVPHYYFVALPMLYSLVLLIPHVKEKFSNIVIIGVLVITGFLYYIECSYKETDNYSMIKPWIACEQKMQWTLDTMDELSEIIKDGNNVLVIGLEDTVETMYRSSYYSYKYLPEAHFDVQCNIEQWCGDINSKVTYTYGDRVYSDYDVVIEYVNGSIRVVQKK